MISFVAGPEKISNLGLFQMMFPDINLSRFIRAGEKELIKSWTALLNIIIKSSQD